MNGKWDWKWDIYKNRTRMIIIAPNGKRHYRPDWAISDAKTFVDYLNSR